jgi:antitoxin (DNA-binding transcriptional repressor) of toxin-antitoxin stability system
MKTASVADLRNNFATVSRWIYEGESVAIRKRGKAFAILSPAGRRKKKAPAWPAYEARLKKLFPNGPAKGWSSEQIVDHLRGPY